MFCLLSGYLSAGIAWQRKFPGLHPERAADKELADKPNADASVSMIWLARQMAAVVVRGGEPQARTARQADLTRTDPPGTWSHVACLGSHPDEEERPWV